MSLSRILRLGLVVYLSTLFSQLQRLLILFLSMPNHGEPAKTRKFRAKPLILATI